MLQPCASLRAEHVEEFIRHKQYFLVTQEYQRGYGVYAPELFVSLLITPYFGRKDAANHLSLLKKDRYAAIIDLERTSHYRKLSDMLKGSKYILFYAFISDADQLNRTIYSRHKPILTDCVVKKYPGVTITSHDLEQVIIVVASGEFFLDVYAGRGVYRIALPELERVIRF